jgi:LEA14-like dessication related protein
MRRFQAVMLSLLLLSLSACALFPNRDPVNINVVGLEPLPSQDLEVRFAIKIRVQNPNETAIDYNGIALDLEVNGHSLASVSVIRAARSRVFPKPLSACR